MSARQLTVQQVEAIAGDLPVVGNGLWLVRQKVASTLDGRTGALASSVSDVLIIAPGDHPVGTWVETKVLRPSASAQWWCLVALEEAGWTLER